MSFKYVIYLVLGGIFAEKLRDEAVIPLRVQVRQMIFAAVKMRLCKQIRQKICRGRAEALRGSTLGLLCGSARKQPDMICL